MKVRSAGIAAFRTLPTMNGSAVEVLLGHLGGPFWAKRHDGAWSFPKGLLNPGEEPFAAALREFREEVGFDVPGAPSLSDALDLGVVRSASKEVHLFAMEMDPDLSLFRPGTFEMEWPPRSGRLCSFPELDHLVWTHIAEAPIRLSAGQRPFIDRLLSARG